MRKKSYAHAAVKPIKLQLPRKVALSGLSVVLVSALMCPGFAFAAEYLWIDDAEQEVGNSGEGWAWVDADNLNLDGYNGGQIYAEGNLAINVSGENTITSDGSCDRWHSADGIAVDEGNLAIQGEGSLDINADYDGIYLSEGNLTIDGTALNITTDGSDSDYYVNGIYAYGDVEITDATINIDASAEEGAYGIHSSGTMDEQGGHVAITNSDVSIKVSEIENEEANSVGILAYTFGYGTPADENAPASIAIDGSNVDIEATKAAMIAQHGTWIDEAAENPITPSEVPAGTISITNSTITSPKGALVVDFILDADSEEEIGGEMALMDFGPRSYPVAKGQTIATAEGTITSFDDPNIATSVTIETEAQDKPAQGVPQMGDATMLLIVAAFVACAAAVAGLVLVRKRQ